MKRGQKQRRQGQVDYKLLALALGLLAAGLVMVCSASWILGDQQFHDPWHFIKRQAAWSAIGLLLMSAFSRLPYQRLRRWVWPAMGVTLAFLTVVLFFRPVAGVKRWLHVGPLGIQPAEFAKLTVVLYLADYLDRRKSRLSSLLHGMIVPWTVLGSVLVLIGLEPDLGTPALLFMVGLLLLFVGGTRFKHLAGTFIAAIPVLIYELVRYPYRRRRLLNFMQPFRDARGTGYQLVQSLYAVGSGGWLGKGLGNSKLKLGYLPAPHTDFIFPILCEELGLLGSLAVIGFFVIFLIRGMRIARNAPDLFGMLLASGLTFLLCLQAFFNVAMSIGLLPTKGLPLPFFSYGGSAMMVTLIAVGMLLSVSRQADIRSAVHR